MHRDLIMTAASNLLTPRVLLNLPFLQNFPQEQGGFHNYTGAPRAANDTTGPSMTILF